MPPGGVVAFCQEHWHATLAPIQRATAMPEHLAYLNGRFLPLAEASLPLHDAGFVLGATVTDLCRTVHHRLYRWEDHLDRFLRNCTAACLKPPSGENISAIVQQLVDHNAALLKADEDLALVLFITPGTIGYYAG